MSVKRISISLLIAGAVFLGYANLAAAQSTSPVTSRPVPIKSSGVPVTNDSTLDCNPYTACGIGATGDSSVVIGSKTPPPPPPPPPILCSAGVLGTRTQTVNRCPAGTVAFNTNSALVKQTSTENRTCPAGPYGAPKDTWSAWSPAATVGEGCGTVTVTNPLIHIQACTAAAMVVHSPQCGFAPTRGSFTGTLHWAGASKAVSLTCANEDHSDACAGYLTVTVGGVQWNVRVTGGGLFRGDYYCGPHTAICSAPGGGATVVTPAVNP